MGERHGSSRLWGFDCLGTFPLVIRLLLPDPCLFFSSASDACHLVKGVIYCLITRGSCEEFAIWSPATIPDDSRMRLVSRYRNIATFLEFKESPRPVSRHRQDKFIVWTERDTSDSQNVSWEWLPKQSEGLCVVHSNHCMLCTCGPASSCNQPARGRYSQRN